MKENQDTFFAAFERYIASIEKASFESEGKTFKKVLFVSVIDALSKCAYPHKSPGKRFTSFVEKFCDWQDCNRVSLPHLIRFLNVIPDSEFSPLRKHIFSISDKCLGNIEKDPNLKEIQKLWPKIEYDQNHPLAKIEAESLTHKWLFYKYRNQLVHNLKEPGYGIEREKDTRPFYHIMETIEEMEPLSDDEDGTWELVYPLGFFVNLCRSGLNELKIYCKENRIDPYESHKESFGTYWIAELN